MRKVYQYHFQAAVKKEKRITFNALTYPRFFAHYNKSMAIRGKSISTGSGICIGGYHQGNQGVRGWGHARMLYGAGKVDCGGLFRSDSDTEEAAGAYRIQSGRNGRIRTADPLRVEQML